MVGRCSCIPEMCCFMDCLVHFDKNDLERAMYLMFLLFLEKPEGLGEVMVLPLNLQWKQTVRLSGDNASSTANLNTTCKREDRDREEPREFRPVLLLGSLSFSPVMSTFQSPVVETKIRPHSGHLLVLDMLDPDSGKAVTRYKRSREIKIRRNLMKKG